MRIKLSDHFSCKKMLLFTLPSIAMVVFTSIYSIVDGFFVANFVGECTQHKMPAVEMPCFCKKAPRFALVKRGASFKL